MFGFGAAPVRRPSPARLPDRLSQPLELASLSLRRDARAETGSRKAAPLAELCFRWPRGNTHAGLLRAIEIEQLPREALQRLRVDAGPRTVQDLVSLSDGHGRSIPAGELLWAMAAPNEADRRGRLSLPLQCDDLVPQELTVTLWVSQITARPSVGLALATRPPAEQRHAGA